jgi:hypothetical protein
MAAKPGLRYRGVFDAIRRLVASPEPPKQPVEFVTPKAFGSKA